MFQTHVSRLGFDVWSLLFTATVPGSLVLEWGSFRPNAFKGQNQRAKCAGALNLSLTQVLTNFPRFIVEV